jgi:hypothetical protein
MVKQKSAAPAKTSSGLKFLLKSEVKQTALEGKTVIAIRGDHDF